MHKWSWLIAVLVLMTSGSSAALAQGKPQSAAYPTCVVKKITVNQAVRVTPRGGCTLRGKPVVALPHYAYTSADADKYSCGLTAGVAVRGKFVLGPAGISTASGSIRYLPKVKYPKVASKAKPFNVAMTGSGNLQCGKLINLPPPSVLCDHSKWLPYSWPGWVEANCGQPVRGGLAFSSLPTLVDGILSAGHVVSPSGRCVFGPWNDPQSSTPGLRLLCSDDVGAEVVLAYGGVANSQGRLCPDSLNIPTYYGQRRMDIPKIWKGTVYIVAVVDSYAHWSTTQNHLGHQAETTAFVLQGSQEPC